MKKINTRITLFLALLACSYFASSCTYYEDAGPPVPENSAPGIPVQGPIGSAREYEIETFKMLAKKCEEMFNFYRMYLKECLEYDPDPEGEQSFDLTLEKYKNFTTKKVLAFTEKIDQIEDSSRKQQAGFEPVHLPDIMNILSDMPPSPQQEHLIGQKVQGEEYENKIEDIFNAQLEIFAKKLKFEFRRTLEKFVSQRHQIALDMSTNKVPDPKMITVKFEFTLKEAVKVAGDAFEVELKKAAKDIASQAIAKGKEELGGMVQEYADEHLQRSQEEGGFLSKYKEKYDTAQDKYQELKDKTEEKYEQAQEKYQELKEKVEEKYDELKQKGQELAAPIQEKIEETREKYQELRDRGQEMVDRGRERLEKTAEGVRERASDIRDRGQEMVDRGRERLEETAEGVRERASDIRDRGQEVVDRGRERLEEDVEENGSSDVVVQGLGQIGSQNAEDFYKNDWSKWLQELEGAE